MRRLFIASAYFLVTACTVWVGVAAQSPADNPNKPLVFTATPRYDAIAWMRGSDRFPAGAKVMVHENGQQRELIPDFAATADPAVSFDATAILFAGKRGPQDTWQIWEVAGSEGKPRRVTNCSGDCVRPFYLPGDRLAYAQKVAGRFVIAAASLEGGNPLQLTYAPGNSLPTDILRDGRILFEAAYPMGNGRTPEIYTIYSDGSGVESYRCDHGPRRQAGKQTASGDIVFVDDKGLGRFTSALAHGIELKAPGGDFTGDVVESGSEKYLVSWRPSATTHYSLQIWNTKAGSLSAVATASDADLVQPAIVAPRPVSNQHPSGLHEWSYANLLCLNTYTSKQRIPTGSVKSARLYTADEKGKPSLLGASPVEADGSFYVQVPGDKPLQIELLDAQGKTVVREKGWWWMRKGEQRICVGCHAGPERSPENAVPAVLVKSTKPIVMTGK